MSYLLLNSDVERSRINPYYHYLRHGLIEGRIASSSISPSIRSRLLFGDSIHNWVERLRPHVDIDFYKRQFDDVVAAEFDLVAHFAYRGWREGKSPNASFDVSEWLQANPTATRFAVNPLLIYLEAVSGQFDLNSISDNDVIDTPPLTDLTPNEYPSAETNEPSVNGTSPSTNSHFDDLSVTCSEFDRSFYLASNPDIAEADVDPAEHYLYTGWRERRNPNDQFDTKYYLDTNKDVQDLGVNPFVHYLTVGRAEGRLPRPAKYPGADVSRAGDDLAQDQGRLSTIAREFDTEYYLAAYPDIAKANVDPLLHFLHSGWREGRNPSLQFDTGYYLSVNSDVRDAGVNPFWHYLICGKVEGRLPRRPGGYRRQIIDAATEQAKRPLPVIDPKERRLRPAVVLRNLSNIIKRRRPFVVSVSHDRYINVIGGTQIFIADEQKRFNELGCAYVHISPRVSQLSIADHDAHFCVNVVVDGKYLGIAELGVVTDALNTIRSKNNVSRPILVVHSVLGFHTPDVIKLAITLRAARSIYWLHDYSSVCEGFNLLRNDAEFCGAPPESSLACKISVYGKTRRQHVEKMQELFGACKFDVLSPSAYTLRLWVKAIDLPRRSQAVHPHWGLIPIKAIRKRHKNGAARKKLNVAFVGFPSPNKGWPLFSELVQRYSSDPRYEFFHFAARDTSTLPNVTLVRNEVTPDDRYATQRLLTARAIDLVLVLSPWPETFSFVAHEAIVAGTQIICLSDSGNVAELVSTLGCGQVLADDIALFEFFGSGSAFSLVKTRSKPRTAYRVAQIGTTATFKDIERITAQAAP